MNFSGQVMFGTFQRVNVREVEKDGVRRTKRSVVLCVDFSEVKRDEVYINIDPEMETPQLQKGESYGIPVESFTFGDSDRILFKMRTDVGVLPALTRD